MEEGGLRGGRGVDRAGLMSGGWRYNGVRQAALPPNERPSSSRTSRWRTRRRAGRDGPGRGGPSRASPVERRAPACCPASSRPQSGGHSRRGRLPPPAPCGRAGEARFALMRAVTDRGGRYVYLAFVDRALVRAELSSPIARPGAKRSPAPRPAGGDGGASPARGPAPTSSCAWRASPGSPLPAQPGQIVNVPGGAVLAASHRDGADGLVVVDSTILYTVSGILAQPVALRLTPVPTEATTRPPSTSTGSSPARP